MDITELHEIAAKHGLSHAEFCLEQWTTQVGRDEADPLWVELGRMLDQDYQENLKTLP